jgi:hypothetical protein
MLLHTMAYLQMTFMEATFLISNTPLFDMACTAGF